jgi:hypothetical protein
LRLVAPAGRRRSACRTPYFVEYVVGYSDDDTSVPARDKQAMLLMISDWDANRVPRDTQSDVVARMLMQNKVFYQP